MEGMTEAVEEAELLGELAKCLLAQAAAAGRLAYGLPIIRWLRAESIKCE